jgi:tetratricopeptide (TPR) repeat protein
MAITQANIVEEFRRAGRLQAEGRLEQALALWDEITAAAPRSPEAFGNRAGVLLELGRLEEAEASTRRALALKPHAAWAHYRLGRAHALARRFAEAEAAYRAALSLDPADPKARLALGQLHLALGDTARGWPLYEARTEIADQNARKLDRPGEWRGEPLAGKSLLVWPEQGFGDQIQFARFVPMLAAMGAQVTLAVPPELMALFRSLEVRLIAQTPAPPPDLATGYWTLLLSIPGRLGIGLGDLPAPPYLAPPPDRRGRWAGKVPAGTVGVVWRGRPTHRNDSRRSLPSPEILRPLAEAGARLLDLTEPIGDFADLAAVVEQLDLVVTVDTAMAHLAGALGKRGFVLLPGFRTDWRWLEERSDSPWYPSLSLFRQALEGPWEPAVQALVQAYVSEFRS